MRKLMIAAAVGAVAAATPAIAQQVTGGLVNVTVDDVEVLNDSLNNNQIEVLKKNNVNVAAPINIQVPIALAANVCDTTVAVLQQDLADDGSASCTAQSGSRALGGLILGQHAGKHGNN